MVRVVPALSQIFENAAGQKHREEQQRDRRHRLAFAIEHREQHVNAL